MFGAFVLLALMADGGEVPWSTRYEVSNWSIADGLPQTSITGIAQDDRGFLWLTTFGGVVRFDGAQFERLPLAQSIGSPRFTAIAVLDTTLWFGTQDGTLWRARDRGKGALEQVALEPAPDIIWRITRRRSGTLLVAAGRAGVFEVGESARQLDTRLSLRVVETPDGAVWTMGADAVACLEGCPSSQGLPLAKPSDLWVEDGRVMAAGATGVFEATPAGLEQVSPRVVGRAVWDAVNRRSWGAIDGALLVRAERTKRVFLPPPRLRSDPTEELPLSVRALFLDAQQTLWVGSDSGGLYRVRDRFLRHLTFPKGARSIALTMSTGRGGALAAGYCTGLWRVDVENEVVTRDERFPDNACIYSLNPTDAGVLIGSTNRLSRLRDDRLESLYEAPPKRLLEDTEVKASLECGEHLVVGTSEGLWVFDHKDGGLERTASLGVDAGLPAAVVTSLAEMEGGRVLVGTVRGLAELNEGRLTRIDAKEPVTVRDLLVEPERVWVASYGAGLGRLERSADGRWETTWFGTGAGFCTDELSRIIRLGDDYWFNSNAGVYRVTRADLDAFTGGTRASLPCQRLASGEGNGGGMGAGAVVDGALLFPTVEGVVLIRPAEVPAVPPASPVYLESATLGRHTLTGPDEAALDTELRDLEVRLSTPPDAFRPPPRRVWHTLIQDGVALRRERAGMVAKYVDLDPGTWTFEARPEDQPDGPPTAVLRFTISERFWERASTRVFLALAGLAIVVVAFQVLASRARALSIALEERERAFAARSERDALHRALFDGSPAPLLTYKGGVLAQANPAARAMLALDERQPTLPFADEKEASRYAKWLESEAEAADFALCPRGERRVVRMQHARLGPDTLAVAAIDLTAELEAAQQREALVARTAHAQRLEGLGRLAAGVAHDFNNVLATLQLELEDVRRVPGTETVVHDMQASLDTGKRLTQRFLVFGKEDGRTEVMVLDEGVTRARPMLERLLPPDVKLTVRCEAPATVVELAPAHLDQLLLNLVVNAQEAIGSRGRLEVTTALTNELPQGTIIVAPPAKPWLRLSVIDSGRGMSAETLARAFEPFFSTKAKGGGTGMGLAVVHGVATRSGAGIVVDSTVGRGTSLSILFTPSARTVETSQSPPPMVQPAASPTESRVLICEDNHQLRRALVRLFKANGLTVVDVENGALGLTAFEKERFDLVVTDLVMPELDGAQLITALRAKGAMVPVILASGYPVDAVAQLTEAARAGVESIEKPWKGDSLIQLALRLIRDRK